MCSSYQEDAEYPKSQDITDPLHHFRQNFHWKTGCIYMCGNSLGLASKTAEDSILQVIEKWKEEAFNMWNVEDRKYYMYSRYLAKLMAPIVGADPNEVIIANNTTINIHQAVSTFYKPSKLRCKILVDDINFPSDRYAIDSQIRLRGYTPEEAVRVVKSKANIMYEDDIIDAMTEEVALVLLPTVYYQSAQLLDMWKITKAAKEKGIIIGWDLSHAAGCMEVNLKEVDADFAVWCTCKYLNGGPGSSAALYINRKHFTKIPGLAGWFGNKSETQFLFKQEFDHQQDCTGWQIGTPNIMSMAALEGSLKTINDAGIKNIRKKSLHITGYLMYLVEKKLTKYGFSITSFKEDDQRGGHVCLKHEDGYKISVMLRYRGVMSDFRGPNVIRLTPVALYTSYEEVYNVVDILLDIVKDESCKKIV